MYGYLPGRRMPAQDPELVRRLSLRWLRAAEPQVTWARVAKVCQDFVEGEQWTHEQKAEMNRQKRTALTINKIAPIYRLVCGYQSSNRLDSKFLPQADGVSTEEVAEILNFVDKAEVRRMKLTYTDSEVFADGITTGRGFWDTRLDFSQNDFGQVCTESKDPFSIYIDPDASKYDLSDASYIQESRWVSIEEIRDSYGEEAARACAMCVGASYNSSILPYYGAEEISPARFFGQYENDKGLNWRDVYYMDFVDHQAKRLRLIDTQYAITSIKKCFIDMETGDFEPIPDSWLLPENQHKIEKSIMYAEKIGNPIRIVDRPVRRIRWTVICGDVLVFDSWSPYNQYTITPFFPYFRRGKTRGMVADLIDPQREINKKRSSIADILNRNANSGWRIPSDTMNADQKEQLRRHGASPGFNLEYTPQSHGQKPERLEGGNYPTGLDNLEQKAAVDLKEISGINDSAMGQLDRVQSGKAIEARQRQAVLAIQPYQDNFSRSKGMQAECRLDIYQKHYVEPRIFRILGEDGKLVAQQINQKVMTGSNAVERINDITTGKYMVTVDEVPISATFKQAQFEEAMELLEKLGPVGQALVQTNPALLVDMSSLPRKEDWKQALNAAVGATQTGVDPTTGQPVAGMPGMPGGAPGAPAMLGQPPMPQLPAPQPQAA
jgi:Phage P22-like portal protein